MHSMCRDLMKAGIRLGEILLLPHAQIRKHRRRRLLRRHQKWVRSLIPTILHPMKDWRLISISSWRDMTKSSPGHYQNAGFRVPWRHSVHAAGCSWSPSKDGNARKRIPSIKPSRLRRVILSRDSVRATICKQTTNTLDDKAVDLLEQQLFPKLN